MTAVTIHVPGIPAAQGSMKSLGPGRLVHSNATTLLPWRASVIAHVRQAMEGRDLWPLDGPLELDVTFHLPRPKSAPRQRMWPDKKPDLDKLLRACGDALTQSGVIHDDAQIVLVKCSKQFSPTPGMDLHLRALEQPVRRAS